MLKALFLLMMAGEYVWSRRRSVLAYRFSDTINSLSLGALSQLSGLFNKLLTVGIFTVVYQQVALVENPAFWNSWWGVLLALLFYDLCYYWLHRAGHEVAVFCAAGQDHHGAGAALRAGIGSTLSSLPPRTAWNAGCRNTVESA